MIQEIIQEINKQLKKDIIIVHIHICSTPIGGLDKVIYDFYGKRDNDPILLFSTNIVKQKSKALNEFEPTVVAQFIKFIINDGLKGYE